MVGFFEPSCLIDTALVQTLCVPNSVWVGILLVVFGIAIGAFVPIVGKRYGGILLLAGIGLAVIPYILESLWQQDWFKYLTIGLGAFLLVLVVLFTGKKK